MGLSMKGLKKSLGDAGKVNLGDVALGGLGGLPGVAGVSSYRQDKERSAEAARKRDAAANVAAEALSAKVEAERGVSRDALSALATQAAPTVATPTLDPFWAERQKGLAGTLEARAKGEGPSLAQMQFQQASNTALQKSLGAIRAATGANPALAGRTAALASTNLMGNLAAESGMARLKEQQDAQAALANLLAQGQTGALNARGQDLSANEATARLAAQNQALQAQIHSGMLSDSEAHWSGAYNRGLQAQLGQKPGKDNTTGILATIAGAGLGAMAGGPAGAASGATAGEKVGNAFSLTGQTPQTTAQQRKTSPFNYNRNRWS